MIIPSENLEIDTIYNQNIVFKGGLLKVRLKINPNDSNEIFVQEIDALNNVRTSQTFSGFEGFWKAVAEFEKIIEESMGWKEVFGFEVGMVIELDRDTKKYPKGTFLMITEVDNDGKATRYEKLNAKQVDKISKNKYVTKLTKAIGLDDLIGKGINSLSDLKVGKEYDFNLAPNTQLIIPSNQDIDGFKIDDEVKIDADNGGGSGKIEQFVLLTDENKKSKMYANIRLEDNSLGMIPLDDVKPVKKKTKKKKAETTTQSSIGESNSDDFKELPSTDSRVWGSEFEKGDLVRVRKDYESISKSGGSTMFIASVSTYSDTKRPENPTGKIYGMDNGEAWEGKDLIKVY